MRSLFALSVFGTLVGLATPALAGGYFYGPNGAQASGRGGAFVAKADDISAVIINPAGLAHGHGTLLQLGNRFSYNALSYKRAPTLDWGSSDAVPPYVEFATVDNEKPWQVLDPLLGVATDFGLPDFRFALAAVAVTGASREEFPITGGQRYMMLSREALIVNYAATAAYHYREVFGAGVSLVWVAVPKLRYDLVIQGSSIGGNAYPVSSELDIHATTDGSDLFTPNAVLGTWYRPAPFLELALSGQIIPADVKTKSKLTTTAVDPDVAGDITLKRDGIPADDVSITFPLPLTARAGARYRHLEGERELFDVELDFVLETWRRVKRFDVESNNLIANLQGNDVPIGRIEIEKHWRNTLAVMLGGDYAAVKDLVTVRAGAFYESAVANPHYLNVDFASGEQLGGTLGASFFYRGAELALAYEYRHQPTAHVSEGDARVHQVVPGSACTPPYTDPALCDPNYPGIPAPAVNAGTYDAHAHVASIDLMYRF